LNRVQNVRNQLPLWRHPRFHTPSTHWSWTYRRQTSSRSWAKGSKTGPRKRC